MTEENNQPPEETSNPEVEPETPQTSAKKPFLTALTIRVLRGIITRLESTVEKLEKETPTATQSVGLEETQGETTVAELRGWDKILRQVRDRFPIAENLPDFLLTTVLVGGSVALVWGSISIIPEGLFQSLPPSSSSEETEVSQQPEQPQPSIPPPEETTIEPTPEPEPEPEPELTPEQSLIAAIQEQVSEITTGYAEGLIESIEANFRDSRLIIAVNDQWFSLSPERQDELSKEMLARSRKLDFSKLVLTTPDGKRVARSPVVGEKMVILQRENPIPPNDPV